MKIDEYKKLWKMDNRTLSDVQMVQRYQTMHEGMLDFIIETEGRLKAICGKLEIRPVRSGPHAFDRLQSISQTLDAIINALDHPEGAANG